MVKSLQLVLVSLNITIGMSVVGVEPQGHTYYMQYFPVEIPSVELCLQLAYGKIDGTPMDPCHA